MKRTISIIIPVILAIGIIIIKADGVDAQGFTLIGKWNTSDGVTLEFYEDGTFNMD